MAARVAIESTAPSDLMRPIRLRLGILGETTEALIPNTQDDAIPYADVQVVHQMRPPIERTISTLTLEVRSPTSVTGDLSAGRFFPEDGLIMRPEVVSDATYLATDPIAARPSGTGADTEAILYEPPLKVSPGTPSDWLFYGDDTYFINSANPTVLADNAVLRQNQRSRAEIRRVDATYIQVRGVEIAQRVVDQTYLTDGAIAPKIPVLSETSLTHALRTRQAHQRARCVWIGPVGDKPGPDPPAPRYPDGYTRRFARLAGDEVATAWFEAGCWFHTRDPRMTVLVRALPYHVVLAKPTDGLDYLSGAAIAEWNIWVIVDQLDASGGGWAAANTLLDTSSSPTTRQVTHYPTLLTERSPALAGELLTEFIEGDWALKEGQLYPEDRALVQTLAFSFALPFEPSLDGGLPVRVRLFAERTATPAEFGTPGFEDDENLVLMATGITIWEDPE